MAGASTVRTTSVIATEVQATLASLEEASRRGISNFIIFTDSMFAYQMISGCTPTKEVEEWVAKCKDIIKSQAGSIL